MPVVDGLLEVCDGTDDAVEYHLAGGDAVAEPDRCVLGVGFVYVGEDGCELGSVIGDFEDVVLCLADEVWGVVGVVGHVSGLVEPGGGRVVGFGLSRCLGRTECVDEVLLELGNPSTPLRCAQGRLPTLWRRVLSLAAIVGRPGLILCNFAEASVVEDAGGPEPVVAVGVGVVAFGDFEQVVEDALDTADGFLELSGGVSGEDGVDGGLLCCIHGTSVRHGLDGCQGVAGSGVDVQ